MRKVFLLPILLLTACSFQSAPPVTPTLTPLPFATATLAPTYTPRPSATSGVPTVAPTIAPISASLTAQVNVRVGPDKNATSLGLLNYGNRVQVIGKDESGKWWQIIYPENSTTTGWVTAEYVPVPEEDAKKIPVVKVVDASGQSSGIPVVSAGTPEAPLAVNSTPNSAARTASVKAQIFVRTGPSQAFETLGMVNAAAVVTLTGRNENNVWVQIQYEGGPDGRGWVAAAYLEGANLQGLPIYDNQGTLVAVPTVVSNPGQPTLTATAFSPAAADGDSEANPAVNLVFSPDGVGELTFSSELSSPTGDTTDWVAFTPYEPTNQSTYVYFRLECNGNGGITAILEKDGVPLPGPKTLVCGNYDLAVQVLGGQAYLLVLNADGSAGPLRFVSYKLSIKSQR